MASLSGITIDVGCELKVCKDCRKYNIGKRLYDCFDWSSENKIINFDRESSVITISRDDLIKIIQLVNPAQKPRDIELI